MRKDHHKKFTKAMFLFAAFALWTTILLHVDVQSVGPLHSSVGFATLNRCFHRLTGVHMALYVITDWLSLVPLFCAIGFALLGLSQWIRRKNIWKVDFSILILGGFYIVVIAVYLLFEEFAINYRPVLINGILEVSYPSSTTMLVLCVMSTAIRQLNARIQNTIAKRFFFLFTCVFMVFMITGRLLSGIHWLTDIIGGILLSAGLVTLYDAICS